MKKLVSIFIFLLLCAAIQANAAGPATFFNAGGGSTACSTSNDTAIFDYTVGGSTYQLSTNATNYIGQKFTVASSTTVTEYAISLTDVNNNGSITVALYNDNSGTCNIAGGAIADSTVVKDSGDIAAGPGIVTFTLSSTIALTSGTYWLVAIASGTGAPLFYTFSHDNAGKIVCSGTSCQTTSTNYSIQFGLWGCQ